MMNKTFRCLVGIFLLFGPVSGFSFQSSSSSSSKGRTVTSPHHHHQQAESSASHHAVVSRDNFLTTTAAAAGASLLVWTTTPPAAEARGRATLEQAYERYAPRIKAGSNFYQNDLKGLVARSDWKGIENALQEPPSRTKSDLQKADAGVAERARQAGGFSDARVIVAAELFAASFSENSISGKTKKMQAAIAKVRSVVKELQAVTKQAVTGQEKSGGLFGLGGKKADPVALAKQAKELYVQGGNAWNEYVAAANESLALKFERFSYIS